MLRNINLQNLIQGIARYALTVSSSNEQQVFTPIQVLFNRNVSNRTYDVALVVKIPEETFTDAVPNTNTIVATDLLEKGVLNQLAYRDSLWTLMRRLVAAMEQWKNEETEYDFIEWCNRYNKPVANLYEQLLGGDHVDVRIDIAPDEAVELLKAFNIDASGASDHRTSTGRKITTRKRNDPD